MADRENVAHLLRRFALGASESELDYYSEGGYASAVDKLLKSKDAPETYQIPVSRFFVDGRPLIQSLIAHWTLRMATTRRPLVEKMTLFWHDHFATSASKVNLPPLMFRQNELLRTYALGSFSEMLSEVSKDPAMIFWLDGQYNVRGRANENFAREVMELFTLGVDHYTEKDIQEAARAFTGWSFQLNRPGQSQGDPLKLGRFIFRQNLHDNQPKTVFGKEGDFDGDDILGMLTQNPQTASYLTRKIWQWFVYDKPDAKIIDPLATKFFKSDLDISVLLREIMLHPEFVSAKAKRAIFKTPIDFVMSTVRSLGIGESMGAAMAASTDPTDPAPPAVRFQLNAISQACEAMGMKVFFPPDVAGWDGGQAWISSATMIERILWADRLFGQATRGTRRAQLAFPIFSQIADDLTPLGISKRLCSIFDVSLPPSKMDQLEKMVVESSGNQPVGPRNANLVASKVCRLIFGTPEFQMA